MVLDLARTRLATLNAGALDDPCVTLVVDDGFRWLREARSGSFDAVIVDLPDPDTPVLARLYSTEFYGLVERALAPGGQLVVQSGSPYSTPQAYWRTVGTVASAGFGVTPYHVHVPSFGDWGFTLAQVGGPPPLALSPRTPELRFLDDAVLAAAAVFPRDRPPLDLEPSTLDRPLIVDDVRAGFEG